MDIALPTSVHTALFLLESNAYESWIVGGYLRDALRGESGADIDIASAAPWKEVQHIFERNGYRTYEIGTAYGTIGVVIDSHTVEITTFRSDGHSCDARHPLSVVPVHSIEEDLARRDFTINALAYHPKRGIIDPYKGYQDILTATLQTVGCPSDRFSEDALRILRCCRFASQLGFSITKECFCAMLTHKNLLAGISQERIRNELELLLVGKQAGATLIRCIDVIAVVLPELRALKTVTQRSENSSYNLLQYTAQVIEHSPAKPTLRWAALFHQVGKPESTFLEKDTKTAVCRYAHRSAEVARGALYRLGLSSQAMRPIITLIEQHDQTIKPCPKAVKRTLVHIGGDPSLFKDLCDLKQAQAFDSTPYDAQQRSKIQTLQEILRTVLAHNEAFSLKGLAINGEDVLALGVPRGPLVGKVLQDVLNAVIDEEVPNEAPVLQSFVRRWKKAHLSHSDSA